MIDPYKPPESEPSKPEKKPGDGSLFLLGAGCAAILMTALLESPNGDRWTVIIAVSVVAGVSITVVAAVKLLTHGRRNQR